MPRDAMTTASVPTQVEQHGLPPTIGLAFSKDRALHLDALLRSLLRKCQDTRNLELHILYNASKDRWRQQYLILEHYWCTRLPVIFHAEQDFRTDVPSILGLPDQSGAHMTLLHKGLLGRMSRLLRRIPVAAAPWQHVLFLVDDNLFVRRFAISDIVRALRAHPQAIGFSLRLGRNTTYCYSLDRQQAVPTFSLVEDNMLTFDWTAAECDFGYPLELSSSV